MIRGFLLAATALAALSGATAPRQAFAADERLIHHPFSENEVVRIDGRQGVQATIAFGEGEAIENVAIGDSQSWQVTPNKRADLLFVKPIEAGARTNMTVVTNRHTYFFDLVATPKGRPVYLLRFTYKDQPGKKGEDASLAALTPAEQAALGGEALAADPAMLNFAWAPKGDARVLPARVYDDGNATYLLWGEKSEVPAILVLNEKGEEGPVNYSVRGRTIVIDDVPGKILLRSGKASATLSNSRPPAAAPAVVPASVPSSVPASVPVSVPGPAPAAAVPPGGRAAPATVAVAPAAPSLVREN